MVAGSVITISRATFWIPLPMNDPPEKGFWNFLKIVQIRFEYSQKIRNFNGKFPCDGFSVLMPDGEKKAFLYDYNGPFANKMNAPADDEQEALSKAINFALAKGYVADPKSMSLFANHKISNLLMSRR